MDADFSGPWHRAEADSSESVLSCTGFTIMYWGCPITWMSKLQTEITLSTTEDDYISLSQSMREVVPFLNLLKEVSCTLNMNVPVPKLKCCVYEDNNGCITLANYVKFSPCTKHIVLKYHHFRNFVKNKTVEIDQIDTTEKTADIFTKPLEFKQFTYLRKKLMGW